MWRGGGTGRRTGLKILRKQNFHVGSIPTRATKILAGSSIAGSSAELRINPMREEK